MSSPPFLLPSWCVLSESFQWMGVKASMLEAATGLLTPSSVLCLSPVPCPSTPGLGISCSPPYPAVTLFLASKGTGTLCAQPPDIIKCSFVALWAMGSLGWNPSCRGRTQMLQPRPQSRPQAGYLSGSVAMCSWDTRQIFFGAGTKLFVEPRKLIFFPYISRDKLTPRTRLAIQFVVHEKV